MVQPLEGRRMFAVAAAVDAGGVLRVAGDGGEDVISVAMVARGVRVSADGVAVGTFAGVSGVQVAGGGGDDEISVVGVDASVDGGDGEDVVWVGGGAKVSLSGAEGVNRLPAVLNGRGVERSVGKKRVAAAAPLGGATLAQPGLTHQADELADFSGGPLFAAGGPSAGDVGQGNLGDCYLLAALGSVAEAEPGVIRRTVAPLGDGTYAVRFMHGKVAKYYEVDASLPAISGFEDEPAYADLGAEGSLWVALVEKAYAMDRGGSYTKLDRGGWMGDVYASLGMSTRTMGVKSGLGVGAMAVLGGEAVTIATKTRLPLTSGLVPDHAYIVESVGWGVGGSVASLTLRNPWGDESVAEGAVFTVSAAVVRAQFGAVAIGG